MTFRRVPTAGGPWPSPGWPCSALLALTACGGGSAPPGGGRRRTSGGYLGTPSPWGSADLPSAQIIAELYAGGAAGTPAGDGGDLFRASAPGRRTWARSRTVRGHRAGLLRRPAAALRRTRTPRRRRRRRSPRPCRARWRARDCRCWTRPRPRTRTPWWSRRPPRRSYRSKHPRRTCLGVRQASWPGPRELQERAYGVERAGEVQAARQVLPARRRRRRAPRGPGADQGRRPGGGHLHHHPAIQDENLVVLETPRQLHRPAGCCR
ncbi:hypothetical protein QJS66_14765 [Kocuria rhizophila]|nr:hypothetical protein QJS66_14765 [Kocuria rhizophila]